MTRMTNAAVALALSLALSGCASSGTSAPKTAEQIAAMGSEKKAEVHNVTAADEDRVYCRRDVVTGSHKKRTVCRTASQRKAESEAAQEAIRSVTRGSGVSGSGDQ